MADDINKKISIDVQVNTDSLQQVDQYKTSFDNLRTVISSLGKPLTDLSKNIGSLNNDLSRLASATEKYAAQIIDASKKASDQQAKINTESNQKLKTHLTEADKLKEQALLNTIQLQYRYYGAQASIENAQYSDQKKKLDDLLKTKQISTQAYNLEAEKLLQEHNGRIGKIMDQYLKDDANKLQQPDQLPGAKSIKVPDITPFTNLSIQKVDLESKTQVQLTAVTKKGEDSRSKMVFDGAKKLANKVLSYFVKTEGDKSKAAAKTNATIATSSKSLQDVIGAKIIQNTVDISKTAYSIFTEGLKLQTDAKVKSLEAAKTKELSNTSLTAAGRLQIEEQYKQREAKVKLKAFKEQQKADIAQAVINGAVAITKVSAQSGLAAPFAIGVVIAETATQIAKIASTKPPAMAKGGYFKSDGKGTVLPGYSRTDNTNAYLRSGEAIVVSEAMRDPWARNLVSAVNVAYGGRDFSVPNLTKGYAVGGIFTDGGNANRYYNQPMNDQKNLANTVAYQLINNFPPVYVDVKDINNQQNILTQTINRVNL